jgi:hypothetical protein
MFSDLEKKSMLLESFNIIWKDYEDCKQQISHAVGIMFKYDSKLAFQMWEKLLRNYEKYIQTEDYSDYLCDRIISTAIKCNGEKYIAEDINNYEMILNVLAKSSPELNNKLALYRFYNQILRVTANNIGEEKSANGYDEILQIKNSIFGFNRDITKPAAKIISLFITAKQFSVADELIGIISNNSSESPISLVRILCYVIRDLNPSDLTSYEDFILQSVKKFGLHNEEYFNIDSEIDKKYYYRAKDDPIVNEIVQAIASKQYGTASKYFETIAMEKRYIPKVISVVIRNIRISDWMEGDSFIEEVIQKNEVDIADFWIERELSKKKKLKDNRLSKQTKKGGK